MELESFREPNGDAAEKQTNVYLLNGKGYAINDGYRKSSCKKYMHCMAYGVLVSIIVILALLLILHSNPDTPSSHIPMWNNGESHLTLTMNGRDESVSNGKHLTSSSTTTTQSDQVPNAVTVQELGMSDGNMEYTTHASVNEVTQKAVDEKMLLPTSSEERDSTSEEVYYLLPGDLHPITYRVVLIPHFLTNMTTNGNVSIEFKCHHETSVVTLNARDLLIEELSVSVTSHGGYGNIGITSIYIEKESEMLKIALQEPLKPLHVYTVSMSFQGMIGETPKGLYRTIYTENDRYGSMVNTLFSPNEARSVFPCFDEPLYKARFSFVLGRPQAFHTLSNMNLLKSIEVFYGEKYFLDVFDQTPPMSTYLTAFAITEFLSIRPSPIKETNITFAGHSEPLELAQMAEVLNWMEKLTTFFGKYFGISYPLPKMDLVAVPNQFFDAMENWGLIIFRKNMAFVNEKTTEDDKQRTFLTLAHEIAHQWFGNLVTPKWWDNLWLKEGFSTFFGYFAVNEIQKGWNINDKFQTEILEQAFKVDALESSIPLSKSVSKTTSAIFDVISYDKGASVIRMMAHFMGMEKMRQGVISYLNKYAYSIADQEDLWNALKDYVDLSYTGDIDLKTVMDSWTYQVGYPVVHVTRQDYNLEIRQERLLLNGKTQNVSTWWTPISYTTQSENNFDNTRPKLWLTSPTVYRGEFLNLNDWIIVNVNQTGYYRVNYDETNWMKLITAYETLPTNTKAQIISDSLFLAQASILKYDLALSVALGVSSDTEYLPWKAFSSHIYYIANLVRNMPAYGNFRVMVLNLLSRVYNSYKSTDYWHENSSDLRVQLHTVNILSMACYFDLPECLQSSYDLFQEKMATKRDMIPFYMRHIVYCAAVKHGGQRIWDHVYNTLKNISVGEERNRLLHALGCSKESWLLTKTLSAIMTNEIPLRTEEAVILYESVMANPVGSQIGVNFIRDQWTYLLKKLGSSSVLYKMVSNIVTFINSPHYVTELKTLVANIQMETKEKSVILQQAIESAENNIIWMNKNYGTVSSFVDLFVNRYSDH